MNIKPSPGELYAPCCKEYDPNWEYLEYRFGKPCKVCPKCGTAREMDKREIQNWVGND